MDSKTYEIVKSVADKYGLPLEVWFPIAMKESGLNPTSHALTSKEDSRGIFQVNVFAHPDANSSRLYDAKYNAEYWIPSLTRGYQQGKNKGLTGLELTKYVDKNVQRPAKESPRLTTYYNQLIRGEFDGVSTSTSNTEIGQISGGAYAGGKIENTGIADSIRDAVNPVSGVFDQATEFIKIGAVKVGLFLALLFFIYLLFKDSIPSVPTPMNVAKNLSEVN